MTVVVGRAPPVERCSGSTDQVACSRRGRCVDPDRAPGHRRDSPRAAAGQCGGGSGAESGTTAFVSHLLGDPKPGCAPLTLTVLVVTIFILKDLAAIAYTWWLAGFKAFKHVELASRLLRMFLASPYTQVSGRSSSEMMRTMTEASSPGLRNGRVRPDDLGRERRDDRRDHGCPAHLRTAALPLRRVHYFGVSSYVYLRVIKPRMGAAGVVASTPRRAPGAPPSPP